MLPFSFMSMRTVILATIAAVVAFSAFALPAQATEEGYLYNNEFALAPGTYPHQCIPGSPTSGMPAYDNNANLLPFTFSYQGDLCPYGGYRISRLHKYKIGSSGVAAYMNRGGGSSSQPHAFIKAANLGWAPSIVSTSELNGNGRSAPGCSYTFYTYPQGVTSMPTDMNYKTNKTINGVPNAEGQGLYSIWANYADPGNRPEAGRGHYNYLLWNLPRRRVGGDIYKLDGGGSIEATLRAHTQVTVCQGAYGVKHQILPSFKTGTDYLNGWVDFGYARVNVGGEYLYGWVLVGYWRCTPGCGSELAAISAS